METMFRVVNYTTGERIVDEISNDPSVIKTFHMRYNTFKKFAIMKKYPIKDYTSRCFEYIEYPNVYLVFTMDFI